MRRFHRLYVCFFFLFFFTSLDGNGQLVGVPEWVDSCVSASFRGKLLQNFDGSANSEIKTVHEYIDGDLIVTGQVFPRLVNVDIVYGLVMRLSAAGELRWIKYVGYNLPGTQVSIRSSAIAENNDIVCVTTTDIVRLDPSGNIVWKRKLWPPQSGYICEEIIATQDKGFLIAGLNEQLTKVIKLDSHGSIVWKQCFAVGSSIFARSVTESPSAYYLTGFIPQGNNIVEQNLVMKMDKETGRAIWTKGVHKTSPNGTKYIREVYDQIVFSDGLLYLTGNSRYPSQGKAIQATLTLTEEGEFVDARRIENSEIPVLGSSLYRHRLFDIGTRTGVQNNEFGDIFLYRLDEQDRQVWAWHYPFYGQDWVIDMKVLKDSSIVIGGRNQLPTYDSRPGALVIKTMNEGKPGNCTRLPFQVTITHFKEDVSPVSLFFSDEEINNGQSEIEVVDGTGYHWQLECNTKMVCRLGKIDGDSVICVGTPVLYKTRRGGDCPGPVNFTAPAGVQLQRVSDTSVLVISPTPGQFKLHASISAECGSLKDSLSIAALYSPGPVKLGPDTTICDRNQIILRTGTDYFSYQWQDGSVQPDFNVNEPGKYNVKVTDACGYVSSDTIIVSLHKPVLLDLGADKIKCNYDTLHLSATAGFLSYSWSPQYRLNSPSGQTIVVNPAVDTSYILNAEKEKGCFAFDTIKIKVLHSPAIDLGPDLRFCEGVNITLNAGIGFQTYQWSTGEITPQIKVSAEGLYYAKAAYSNGCISRDTILVMSPFKVPLTVLNQQTTLCMGENRMLTPGSGFADYLWQDGSTGSSITVNDLGEYWVRVRDNNGCSASDTVVINKRLPLPIAFLFPDTAICSYDQLQLHAKTEFKTYSWSTASTATKIIVEKPGFYWLEVTDQNNCVGKDSIVVSNKYCPTGFYVPTAFTPNNNGSNDKIRPVVFGQLQVYEFSIYNRWGHKVFSSTRPGEGWNGMVGERVQDAGVFVWSCKYQLTGEKVKVTKGTFLLLK